MADESRRTLMMRARRLLEEAGVEHAAREARWMLEAAAGLGGAALMAALDDAPSRPESLRYEEWVERRVRREPLQYILGEAEFRGRLFGVEPGVLIPRPETEWLVDWVVREAPEGGRVMDVGTGSGCIAVSIAAERPDLELLAVDVSAEALRVARGNAARHHVRVEFRQMDVLIEQDVPLLDVLVSNPPYVPTAERASMQPEVLAHEPALALFPGDDLLVFYRVLAALGQARLRGGGGAEGSDGSDESEGSDGPVRGGLLVAEVHTDHAGDVAALWRDAGFVDVHVHKDLFGRDRVVTAVKA
ncbi:MAG: peptide chain release factor N(5)-glutamine methyltransferase [Rhodothermales bacterium]